ncbi:MAG: Uma2 family endonuclease [Egibacteraceae bacterium]
MSAEPTPELRWRFTVDEYERMGQVGIFGEDDRVELLDGEIVNMTPIGPLHAGTVNYLAELLFRRPAGRAIVIVQNPLRLAPYSEPQPDIVVARRRDDYYRLGHPTAGDILLAIEVSDSSLRTDRKIKVPLYAYAGVPELWLADLAGRAVTVHTEPRNGAYAQVRTAHPGESLTPCMIPDLTVAVSEIFGTS